ncbi:MAG: hypothetical protein ACRDNS_16680, partial [Trebonia sp.]
MKFEASRWQGLLRPTSGPVPAENWTAAGLLVPDVATTAAQLGLVSTGTSSAWFEEYVNAYVTADDYLTGLTAAAGLPVDLEPLIGRLLLLHPREIYLSVLVALNHATHRPELAKVYEERFLSRLSDVVAGSLRRALDGSTDGTRRAIL